METREPGKKHLNASANVAPSLQEAGSLPAKGVARAALWESPQRGGRRVRHGVGTGVFQSRPLSRGHAAGCVYVCARVCGPARP